MFVMETARSCCEPGTDRIPLIPTSPFPIQSFGHAGTLLGLGLGKSCLRQSLCPIVGSHAGVGDVIINDLGP